MDPSARSTITRRRASSYTRNCEFQEAEWPVATASLLQDFERLEATHSPSEVNQPLFALIRARKALGDARLRCRWASKQHPSNLPLQERLTAIASALANAIECFPLSILGQPLARPRPRPPSIPPLDIP